jgi:hypothetical protein
MTEPDTTSAKDATRSPPREAQKCLLFHIEPKQLQVAVGESQGEAFPYDLRARWTIRDFSCCYVTKQELVEKADRRLRARTHLQDIFMLDRTKQNKECPHAEKVVEDRQRVFCVE